MLSIRYIFLSIYNALCTIKKLRWGKSRQEDSHETIFVKNKCLPKVATTVGWRLDNSFCFKELAYVVGFMKPDLDEAGSKAYAMFKNHPKHSKSLG